MVGEDRSDRIRVECVGEARLTDLRWEEEGVVRRRVRLCVRGVSEEDEDERRPLPPPSSSIPLVVPLFVSGPTPTPSAYRA